MAFRNFTLQIIIHLIIIIGLSIASVYFFIYGPKELCLLSSILIVADSLVLIYSFNRTNRSLAYFFESIENNDSQLRFYSKKKNSSIQRLYDSMNRVNNLITETKLQNQRNEEFYKSLIQQSATGLVAMNQLNVIEIANDKACELLGIMVPANFKKLETKNFELWSLLCNLKSGETETFKFVQENTYRHLLIRATGLRFYEKEIKLISIQDIKHELDAKETESWQKLISILTHEIMNSIAPITSLTTTLTKFYKRNETPLPATEINDQVIANTLQGLEIIGERGNGLIEFVTNYRRLTKIPTPIFNYFSANDWLNNIKILLCERLEQNQILLNINVSKTANTIYGDEKLLTQVIINLIYNAIDALSDKKDDKLIKIHIEHIDNNTHITIANNGNMIPENIQDNIFVPFFSTKENGSGIGLSLSRQIIQLHQGYIYLESDVAETKFIIVL